MFSAIIRSIGLTLAAMVFITAAPAQAEWRKAETQHFIVYGDASERDIRTFARRIERFDGLLRAYYPIETAYPVPKLEIYLANGRRDMNRVYPGIGEGVAGFYSSNSGRIYAVIDTRVVTGDVVLFHEYAHHFMFQMQSNAYPSWFVEGFAEYYATADLRNDRIQFGRHHPGRMDALNQGANTWARMEDVLTWRYSASGRYPAWSYYAQAWALTHYFMSTPERTQMLRQYLRDVVGGRPSVEAMQAATGRTPAQLQQDVRGYLTGSINVLSPQIELPEPEVTVTALSPAESAMAWFDIRLDNTPVIEREPEEDGATEKSDRQKAQEARERTEQRAALLSDSQAAAARYPGQRISLLTAARAQRLGHDPAGALATLAPLLSDESVDGDALRIAANALLDRAKDEADPAASMVLRRRASGYLVRSMDADPLDFRTYLGLNDVRRGMASYPDNNDIEILETAVGLAPQAFEGRLRLGQAYMSRQLYGEALSIVTPVANSPHRSRYTRLAREMIASARAALGLAEESPDEALPLDEEEAGPDRAQDEA